MDLAQVILAVAGAYAMVGVAFAILFIFRGIVTVDPSAYAASIPFRLMLFPGVAALWPILLRKWRSRRKEQSP